RRDGRGRDLSPSVFLLEAQRVLGALAPEASPVRNDDVASPLDIDRSAAPRGRSLFAREASPREVTVRASSLRARGALADDVASAIGIDAHLLAHADRCKRVSFERARFFHHKARQKSLLEARAPYAFAVEPTRISSSFGAMFGLTQERPLT